MGHTRWAAIIVGVTAFGLALPAGAGARRHKPVRTCHPAHAKTVAATARVRIFSLPRKVEYVHVTYGCLLRRNRPVKFYLPDFPTNYGHVTVAGHFVAYEAGSDCAASFCDPNSIVLQDLRSGRHTFADGSVILGGVSDLVLHPSGSLAFIASTLDTNGSPVSDAMVVAVPHGGAPTILAPGPGVAPGSLALAGRTLYWTQGGLPRSAPLP